MQITVNVPEEYVAGSDPDEFGRRMKLYTAIVLFSSGRLSAGSASELADVDRHTFLSECARYGIPALNYPPEDLEAELRELQQQG
ncbi:MAG TPA: UPF0175 family protein [Longimicrobiaceae bacterium]|nr:UPF0175 family protein [Longimicrobiaceae bacterium]